MKTNVKQNNDFGCGLGFGIVIRMLLMIALDILFK